MSKRPGLNDGIPPKGSRLIAAYPLVELGPEELITEADYRGAGLTRPLPPPTNAPFKPGI